MTTPLPSLTTEVANLQAELDDVASYIDEYRNFRSKLWGKLYLKKVLQDTFLRPLKFAKIHFADMVSGRTPDIVKSIFALASESDKSSEFYDVCSCDYPIHALSLKVASRFPNYEFQKLARLHDYLEKKALRFTAWQVIGFVVAAASFMLKDLPETVVKNQLGIDYDRYQANVFWAGVVISTYLAIVIALPWILVMRAKSKHKLIGMVLTYTGLLQKRQT